MSRNFKIYAIIIMSSISTICSGCKKHQDILEYVTTETIKVQEVTEESQCIYVYVCGQVTKPSVYQLKSGARVYEAVELAGGFTKKADKTAINLADVLQDGQQVMIPSKEQNIGSQESGTSDSKVNINTADKEELMTLTGIGEAKAESIIAYRQENGSFNSIEDIMNVAGIKDAAFIKMKDNIKVN